MNDNKVLMEEAIQWARKALQEGSGGPFGAIIVKNGEKVGVGYNQVIANNDPSAHAEIVAIRDACKHLQTFDLSGSIIYASCEPCPMCLGAIYWARMDALYFGASESDAAAIGFDDAAFYEELKKPFEMRRLPHFQILREKALEPFREWEEMEDKTWY